MAANQYWNKETPVVKQTTKNEMRLYPVAGKLQVFSRLDGSAHGVGKGATLDLENLSEFELQSLKTYFNDAIDSQLAKRGEKVG